MRFQFVAMLFLGLILVNEPQWEAVAGEGESKAPVPAGADANNPKSDVYRASEVIDMPVRDDHGDEIGKIKDLVINGTTREVLYAVVAMKDTKQPDSVYVMPWNSFQPSYGQGNAFQYVTLGISQSIWMQGPTYTWGQWKQTPFATWGPKVNGYYAEHKSGKDDDAKKTASSSSAKSPAPKSATKVGEKPAADSESKSAANDKEAGSGKEKAGGVAPAKTPAPKDSNQTEAKQPAPKPQEPKGTVPKGK